MKTIKWFLAVACSWSCTHANDNQPVPEMSGGTGNAVTSSLAGAAGPDEVEAGAAGRASVAGAAGKAQSRSAGAAGMAQAPAGGAAGTDPAPAGGAGADQAGAGAASAPYANVTAVSVTGSATAYQFAVSIESADLDCTQYADWWEVLSQDGELLYRRILEHSHTDENGTSDANAPGNTFTRDGGPVEIEPETSVIVRAHMSRGGYNGRVMQGSPSARFVDAAPLAPSFAAGVKAEAPQPTGCSF